MRWMKLACLIATVSISSQAFAQADPNAPQPGQNLRDLIQQARDNMQNQGITGQDIGNSVRQQVQDGTFNGQNFMQQLQDSGIVNQDMMNQIQQFQQQAQNRTQQGRMSSLQQQLQASDDEWAILAPKIQKVMDLSADLGRAGATTNNRQGGRGAQFVQVAAVNPQNPQAQPVVGIVAKAMAELQAILSDPASSDSQVLVKLKALRDAKEQVKTQLEAAEKDLLSLVTLRQEGVLMMNVIVD